MAGVCKDTIGKKFGRLLAIERVDDYINKNGKIAVMYSCICDCGNKIKTSGTKLRTGAKKSCGCIPKEVLAIRNKRPDGQHSFTRMYTNYKKNACARGFSFELSKEDFKYLTKQRCKYCNVEPAYIIKATHGGGDYIYNGIDRINNNLGYIEGNCATCCGVCNIMKTTHTEQFFIEHIKKIYHNI